MTPEHAAAAWGLTLNVADSPDQGLINKTYTIGMPTQYILQWVNPIFSPLIHHDLVAIIAHAKQKGVQLPELILLPDHSPCLIDPDGGAGECGNSSRA